MYEMNILCTFRMFMYGYVTQGFSLERYVKKKKRLTSIDDYVDAGGVY